MRCTHCGKCRMYCPTFEYVMKESWGPRGRVFIIEAIQEGRLTIDKGVLDRIHSCAMCKACDEVCESLVKFSEIMKGLRNSLTKQGIGPPDEYKEMANTILRTGNALGEKVRLMDASPLIKKLPDKAPNLLFLGCVISSSYMNIAEAMIKLLMRAGYDFTVIKEGEECCGAFLDLVGLEEEFKDSLEKNRRIFSSIGISSLVAICPFCYGAFLSLGNQLSVQHSTELLVSLLDEGRIELRKEFNAVVTYFDPCHLGRWQGLYDAPRSLIEAIPGTRLVEMERSRQLSRCCGGPIRMAFPRIRAGMSSAILKSAREAGAEYIITACPTCYHNLRIPALRYKIRVCNIEELVAYSAGLLDKI